MLKKGPKPITPSPQPDSKKWRWCKHEECLEQAKKLEGFGGENEQKLMIEHSELCAVFLENYCWKHLPDKAKPQYSSKINYWVSNKKSLEEANLLFTDLHNATLWFSNMRKAKLYGADLHETNLWGTNLTEAQIIRVNLRNALLSEAQLEKTILVGSNLRKAKLNEARLQGAILNSVNMQGVNLENAKIQGAYLKNVNLQEAELSGANLQGAFLKGVLWQEAKNLTWERIKKVGEEGKQRWRDAQDAYRNLKNYFHQQGLYEDEAKAYYQEKLMAKHEAHKKLFGKSTRVGFKTAKKSWLRLYVWFVKGFKRFGENYATFFSPNENKGGRRRWLGLWILWALAGFGERWMRTIGWAVGTFTFFGLLYWWGTNAGWAPLFGKAGQIKHLLDCLYFSLVTFVTLGFGDIWPAAWLAKIFVGAEVVLGYVFLGMIVVLIARKFGR